MRRPLLVVLGFLPSLHAIAAAQDPSPDSAVISTSATVTRSVRPDLATFTLQFFVVDSTPAAAGERLARRADSLRRALAAAGIPRDSLVTGSRWYWWTGRVEIVPMQTCVRSPDPRLGCTMLPDTGYRVRESIEVRIRDLSKVGEAIDIALAHGLTDISPIRFSTTDTQSMETELLREATQRARERAEIMATAHGGRLGRVLSLSTQPDYYQRFSPTEIMATASSAQGSGTEVTAPSVTLGVTVYGRWRLDPAR
jgi:uncharacterized protein YggE